MVHVALAGASSGLGDSIARAILSNPAHKLTILSRGPRPTLSALGATVAVVDYSSVSSLSSALEGVHTIICTLWDYDSMVEITRNLLAACKAAGVKRFAPSEFALSGAANERLGLYAPKREVWKLVEESGLEYTAFRHGVFMDYLSFGAKGYKEQVLKIFPFVINVAERTATIPGTGNEKLTFTTVADVGRFVAAAVELEKWEPESCMVGETASYKEIVEMAEGVTGEKFTVTYFERQGLEQTVKEKKEAGDVMGRFFTEVMLAIMDGLAEVPATLNKVTDVKPVGIKEFLEKWWGAKE